MEEKQTRIHIIRIMGLRHRGADSRIMAIHIRADSRRTAVTTHMEMFR